MGYGDWMHWTAIVRDIYLYINEPKDPKEKIGRIRKMIKHRKKHVYPFGLTGINYEDETAPIMIYIRFKIKPDHVLNNNPYITLEKQGNYVTMKIISSNYFIDNRFIDHQHLLKTYAEKVGLPHCTPKLEIYLTPDEKAKVLDFVPENKFIMVEPHNYKNGRTYPFEKYQYVVDSLKDQIDFVQISRGVPPPRVLNGVTSLINIFEFRECIAFMEHASLVLTNHGGFTIASNAVNVPTVGIYNAMMHPRLMTYSNERVVYIANEEHNQCGAYHPVASKFRRAYPGGCSKCMDLFKKHNPEIIVEMIKDILELN